MPFKSILVNFILTLTSCITLSAQDTKQINAFTPDPNAILKDIMKMDLSDEHQSFAFWLPFEVFDGLTKMNNKGASNSNSDELIALKNFNVFMARRSYKSDDGMTRVISASDLAKTVKLIDDSGAEYSPLNELPKSISTIVANFKAGVESSSQGIEYCILVYTNNRASGKPVIVAGKRDTIKLRMKPISPLKETSFTWITPFASLLPPRNCPKCGESILPAWKYCPHDGIEIKSTSTK